MRIYLKVLFIGSRGEVASGITFKMSEEKARFRAHYLKAYIWASTN